LNYFLVFSSFKTVVSAGKGKAFLDG